MGLNYHIIIMKWDLPRWKTLKLNPDTRFPSLHYTNKKGNFSAMSPNGDIAEKG